MDNVIGTLRARGLLEEVSNQDLEKILMSPATVYAGFDPSDSSLQAGNLAAIMVLAHFQRCGHRVIAVVGGATGMIGDPSGKSSERSLLDAEDVRRNAEGIRENLSRFLDFNHPTVPAGIVNNNDWLGGVGFIEFLRDVGKHFRMGSMLGKESVRARLNSEAGMSFTEFSYQMLQAYDFLKLYDDEGCLLQIGGSDQWGNITAGIDLIRKVRGVEAYGLTLPLICDSSGRKFGKSEGNAVYLDRAKTSVYDFYQFFVRATDEDAVRFLKIFTFLGMDEIEQLAGRVASEPEARTAQKVLAEHVTRLVHGEQGLETARRASAVFFGAPPDGLRAADLLEVFADVPAAEIPGQAVAGAAVVDVVTAAGLCRSKGEVRRLVEGGGLYINNTRVGDWQATVSADDIVDGRVLILRSGKKNYRLVKVI
jgi:tyrosyl-tRNA synthetase